MRNKFNDMYVYIYVVMWDVYCVWKYVSLGNFFHSLYIIVNMQQ